ncbi:hypothetical protein QYE76_001421 [Lolium multiflorum]|uniref:Transposase (putative) gypsy type domain-containing protein n=1 Tax=Lolium multiflorum TaxID=4521 RepID=A0AAD8VZP2_LOLMU|nr:hypothetical protein QYE76_001421 [Lolium multiflorum]
MASRFVETENKKGSKARNREGERGQWWPCETTDTELRELQNEGMISAHWSFIRDTVVPKPGAGEVVMTKAWVERGLSLPCSEFFLSVLTMYGLQPHNICPNSYLLLSNFATLCEGHLGIRPDVKLWQFFFRVKKETKDKAMLNCGSMTCSDLAACILLMTRTNPSGTWNAGWFYEKNVSNSDYRCHSDHQPRAHHKIYEKVSDCWSYNSSSAKRFPHCSTAISSSSGTISPSCRKHSTGNNSGQQREAERILRPKALPEKKQKFKAKERLRLLHPRRSELAYATKFFNKLTEAEKWDLEQDLLNAMLNNAWGKQDVATSEIQDFKKGVGEFFDKLVCKQKEQQYCTMSYTRILPCSAALPWAENIRTLKNENAELNKQLRTLKAEPLGYSERRRNKFPRDDVLSLAGDDCKDLISASRKICHNLSLKKSRTCGLRKLVKKMDILPELVTDLQASSARGAAAMTLTMCLAHNPEMDLDRVTTGVPPTADVGALLDAVSGYDTRIARRIRHDEFYDKVVLPADEPLEAELQKERDAEARPAESGTQFTWTSSKDAPQEEPKSSAATSEEEEESEEDVSSPAEDAKGKDPEGNASPSKAE